MIGDEGEPSSNGLRASFDRLTAAAQRRLQKELDKVVPHVTARDPPRKFPAGVSSDFHRLKIILIFFAV